jgi:hypothetical protein
MTDATVKVYRCEDVKSLKKAHVLVLDAAYTFGKHLEALRWTTSFQRICQA